MRYGVGDVVEVTFKRRGKTFIVFGEILRMNCCRFSIMIYEATGSLAEWSEVNVPFKDVLNVVDNTDPTDFGEIGLGIH